MRDDAQGPGGPAERPLVPRWLDKSAQLTWRLIVVVVGVAALVALMTRLYLLTLPIIVALIASTLAVPPARRLERRGVPRLIAAVVVVVGGIAALVGTVVAIAPSFVRQGRELVPTVLSAADTVFLWLEEGPIGYDRAELTAMATGLLGDVGGWTSGVASQVGSIALGVGRGVAALLLSIVLLFFFVKDGEQLVGWFIQRTPDRQRDLVRAAGLRGWIALSGYVRGTATVALIDAVGIGIGLAIVGVPLVLPLATLVFLGGFIPVIGAFLTGLLAVLVALADGGPTTALIVFAIVLGVQQLESNLLQPVIMRRAVSLHPVVVLSVLTAGTLLVGVVGAFLAVPIAAVAAAVGNELRLRVEAAAEGRVPGPAPLGGPGVDPTLLLPQAPAVDGTGGHAAGGAATGPSERDRG